MAGELFPVREAARPDPAAVLERVVPLLRAGDTLAHVYSAMPDEGERDPPTGRGGAWGLAL